MLSAMMKKSRPGMHPAMTQRSRKASVGESTRNLVMNANAIKGYAAYAVAVCGPREQFGTLAELRAEAHETETGEDDEEQRRQPFDGGAPVLDAVFGKPQGELEKSDLKPAFPR